jgi:hypothetical protein
VEEGVERDDVRRRRDGEGLHVEEQLALHQVAEQPVGVRRRAAAAEEGVEVGRLDERRAHGERQRRVGGPLDERLRLAQLGAATDRILRQAGDADRCLGTDPVGDAVGGGGDLAGGDAVRRQRRPVGVEHVGVAERRPEVVQLVQQAADLDAVVELDLIQRVATQLAERPLPYRLARPQRRLRRRTVDAVLHWTLQFPWDAALLP